MTQVRSVDRVALLAPVPARPTMYALLAGAFTAPPSAETFAAWRDLAAQPVAATLLGDAAVPLGRIAQVTVLNCETEHATRQEFMNLFKVPGGQYVAPYESAYRDTREIEGQQVSGLLMGPSAIDVQKWYRLAALEIAPSVRELPDHIALELGYLAHLGRKESEFAASGDSSRHTRAREMQRDFLAAHVASWIGTLRDKLYEKSENDYFRAVADLAADFVRRDLADLEAELGTSRRASAPSYAHDVSES